MYMKLLTQPQLHIDPGWWSSTLGCPTVERSIYGPILLKALIQERYPFMVQDANGSGEKMILVCGGTHILK
jgi:hypothetical protein